MSQRRENELFDRSKRTISADSGDNGGGNGGGEAITGNNQHHFLRTRTTTKSRRRQRLQIQHHHQHSSLSIRRPIIYLALFCIVTVTVGLTGWAWLEVTSNNAIRRHPSSSSSSQLAAGARSSPLQAISSFLENRRKKRLRDNDATAMNNLQYRPPFPPPYPIITRDKDADTALSQEALEMCTHTLWHTVETTTIVLPDGETFIHTGDIDDLWLRDSAAQVHPLLIPSGPHGKALIQTDARLDRIVAGLIKRTALYIRHDPYANAFRIDDSYIFNQEQKKLGRHDLISTWNYELDSACYYMRLLYFYWKQSPNALSKESVLRLVSVQDAIAIMVDLWIAEQQHELDSYPKGPLLDCQNCNKPYRYPGLPRRGKGSITNATAGMTWTGFRPSDDECTYGYLVPANMFAVVALGYTAELALDLWQNKQLAEKAQRLAAEIDLGIQEHAIVLHPKFGRIYAYEVDGLGHSLLMDDPNVPSLLSIPYLGYHYDPDVYANTRRFILSDTNPQYRKATNQITGEIEGYGSPHMSGAIRENIWPMSIAVQALTSDNVQEKTRLVEQLVKASAGTGWMHESFDVHNPAKFTRSWFCWADALFAELVLSLTDACPNPLYKYKVLEWRDPETVQGGAYAMDQYSR